MKGSSPNEPKQRVKRSRSSSFKDGLGKLKLTDDGINKRDRIIIENFYSKNIPLCGVLGGGYNKSFDKLIELHSMLHKNCSEII